MAMEKLLAQDDANAGMAKHRPAPGDLAEGAASPVSPLGWITLSSATYIKLDRLGFNV